MTVQELIDLFMFEPVIIAKDTTHSIDEVFCCDLLSVAMGRAPAKSAWVTVMGNMNTLAVASLADVSCIILAEDAALDAPSKEKAISQDITVLKTSLPIFKAALSIHEKL